MNTVDLNTWVSLAALAVFAIAMFTYLDKKFDKIDHKIDTVRDELRSEFKTDIGNLAAIVLRLDERVYDLATGSRQRPLIVPPH